jgi:hypothetical protein
MEKAIKLVEDCAAFSKGDIDVFVRPSRFRAEGVQAQAGAFTAPAPAQPGEIVAAVTSFMAAMTVKIRFDLRTTPAGSPVGMALATDTLAPLLARRVMLSRTFAATA